MFFYQYKVFHFLFFKKFLKNLMFSLSCVLKFFFRSLRNADRVNAHLNNNAYALYEYIPDLRLLNSLLQLYQ